MHADEHNVCLFVPAALDPSYLFKPQPLRELEQLRILGRNRSKQLHDTQVLERVTEHCPEKLRGQRSDDV